VIKGFRHKGLKELFLTGRTAKVGVALQDRCLRRLDALHQANVPEDVNLPGFDFHALRGKPVRYTIHVNGPWCITFEFESGHAYRVNLEQYR
jgi:proteic killer suppression protein